MTKSLQLNATAQEGVESITTDNLLVASRTASYLQNYYPQLKVYIHGVPPVYLQKLCTKVDSIVGRPKMRSLSAGCIQLPRVQTAEFSMHWTGGLEQFASNTSR